MKTELIKTIEESKYFYSKTYPVKYYEMDFNRVLKPSALLNFLQDMATENAEMLGFGPSFVFSRNYAWFLIKYHMEFDEYPYSLDDVVIKTEARGYSKLIAYRDFEIWTVDNKRLGRVASQWMLVDLQSKRPLNLSKTIDFMPQYEKRETDLEFVRILSSENFDYEKIFEIRFDDIDINQHVNNANYIVWALEALPYEFKSVHSLKTIDIIYKKEIAFGHKIISLANITEESNQFTTSHVVKSQTTGDDLCFIQSQWL